MNRGQPHAAVISGERTFAIAIASLVIFGLAILLAPTAHAQDDADVSFDDGYAAYQRGNFYEARTIWETLADAGDVRALYNLGTIYAQGRGVTPDLTAARTFWERAALNGHVRAMHNLALSLIADASLREENVAAEVYDMAVQWLSLAAETGFANSQYSLGKMYQYGLSVDQNDEEAARLFIDAAEQGFASAQYNLGKLYRDGRGVPRDVSLSIQYFEQAAFQGHAGAQNRMATRYARGEGVVQDDITALMWATLSADQGDERGIENLDVLLARMSQEDIATAHEMVDAFRANQ